MASPFRSQMDIFFMTQALEHARNALQEDEVPIGAIVVNTDGMVIGHGHNEVEQQKTQTAHAEIIALKHAGNSLGDWRLNGCWLYVSLEPCAMCYTAIRLSRLAGVVYGAGSPLFGYKGLDKQSVFHVYKENIIELVHGVCKDESSELLREFFKAQRVKKKEES